MFSPKPEDPSDLSPPDELAQALSIWARHSAGAASRGAQAAAYARAQAAVAHNLAYTAAVKIRELDDNECVRKYSEEFEGPMEQSFPSPLMSVHLTRLVANATDAARSHPCPCAPRRSERLLAFL
ncbi:unnamed protein product [Durusdinium trenchii]|uniref:ATP-grasp domain-containing protein n=2 Tax=Durusdinium trenchii TaxID=1381693 RepID=A0ABP0S687_9DINO